MHDKNLDSEGYLTYTENSSSVRRAVAQALREIDLHSNGNEVDYAADLIFGIRGEDRWAEHKLFSDYYTYTELAVFLFTKGFLKVLIENEQGGNINAKIIFPECNKATFKQKLSNIDGPQFQNALGKILRANHMRVIPLHGFELSQNKNILFSIKISSDEILKLDTEYYLSGPDILFPKEYDPFIP